MCGIAGIVGQTHNNKQTLKTMLQRITHRGPDAEGMWAADGVQFGHRRLSVIDTSSHANQPMEHSSGRFVITFNGEIYNFQEIRKSLEQKKYVFQTHSDTEVLLHAWAEWGVACLNILEGMFAFGIWDKQKRELFLVRDRMGEKPLYYFHRGDTLVFASELQALEAHPQCSQEIDDAAVSQFLTFNYILSDKCIYKETHKLPPAHFLHLKLGGAPEIVQYWDLASHFSAPKHTGSEADLMAELNHLLEDITQRTSVADVPLGAFLSGGVDSSAIVAAMCRTTNPANLKTFSIGFHEKGFNELPKSELVSAKLGVSHHTQIVDRSGLDALATIVSHTGEPFADTSMIPTYCLSQFTRANVTVALSGDGGDELFAGYDTYKADRYYQILKNVPGKAFAFQLINKFLPDSFGKVSLDYKIKKFARGLSLASAQQAHIFWRSVFEESERFELLKRRAGDISDVNAYASAMRFYQDVEGCDPLDQHLYVDMKTWLVDDILVKVDRMSMAHSLEVRAPFLNHKLVEWAARLPVSLKMKAFETKALLKKSQEGYLPKDIIYGKKEGFSSPVGHWFTQETQDLTLNGRVSEIFDKPYLATLWKQHLDRKRDNSYKLFGILCLELWLRCRKNR